MIIPAHQSARFIGDTLSSVLGQTHPPHEVIVVDDGSTDQLDAALAPYLDRVVLIRQSNRGPGAARNAALARATGDWIIPLDADDYWDPRRLEAIAAHSRAHPGHRLITTDAQVVDRHGRALWRYYERVRFPDEDQHLEILRGNFVFTSTAVPRDLVVELGGWDAEPLGVDDWDLWIRLIHQGNRAGLVPRCLAYYRIHDANTSGNRLLMARGEVRTINRALGRGGLDRAERAVARSRRSKPLRFVLQHDLNEAVISGQNVRHIALRAATARGIDRRTRLKAVSAALAPHLVRRLSRRRREAPQA